MIMTQTINLIKIKQCLFTEKSNDVLLFHFDIKSKTIIIKSINKCNIGNEQEKILSTKEMDENK